MTTYTGNAAAYERNREDCAETARREQLHGNDEEASVWKARAANWERLRDEDVALQQRRRAAQNEFYRRGGRPLTGRELLETDGYDPYEDAMELDELRRAGY